ncbi:MAG: hypothetical protein ACRELY_11585, partial [Polyangiaceae bacterium]
HMKRFFLLLLPLAACGPSPQAHAPVAEEKIVNAPDTTPPPDDDDAGADTTPTQVDAPPDDSSKTDTPPADAVATKLDARNGFLNGNFGDAPKAYKNIKAIEKKPDRALYKVGGKTQYAGVTVKDVQFLFLRGKLAKISFGTAENDCKAVHDSFERDYGPAQKHVTAPMQADVWRGNDVGLRFNNSGTACTGVMIRRELATTEWTGLDQ